MSTEKTSFDEFAEEEEARESYTPNTPYEKACMAFERANDDWRAAIREADLIASAMREKVLMKKREYDIAKRLRDELAPPPRPRGRPRKMLDGS